MKVLSFARAVALTALCAPYAGAVAQQAVEIQSFMELFDEAKLPQSMKPADLPEGFRAVKIKVSGDVGFMDMFGGMVGMMGVGRGASGSESTQMRFMSMMQAAWTKGDLVRMGRDVYLVTYRMEIGLPELMSLGENKTPEVVLQLHLLNWNSISLISPMPQLTKERLVSTINAMADPETAIKEMPVAEARTRTMSNAKQISLAAIMYGSDYDDVLPYVQSTKTVAYVTYPYVKNREVWQTYNPNKSEFRFNMALGGVSMSGVEDPASIPLFYESVAWPDGSRVVAFLDGHAKVVSEPEWQKMQAHLKPKWQRAVKVPLPANYGSRGADDLGGG